MSKVFYGQGRKSGGFSLWQSGWLVEVIPVWADDKVTCSFQTDEMGYFNFTLPKALNLWNCTKQGE